MVLSDINNSITVRKSDHKYTRSIVNGLLFNSFIVIALFCHSGGATRALLDDKGPEIMKDVAVRGISAVDTTVRPTNRLVASTEELRDMTKYYQ